MKRKFYSVHFADEVASLTEVLGMFFSFYYSCIEMSEMRRKIICLPLYLTGSNVHGNSRKKSRRKFVLIVWYFFFQRKELIRFGDFRFQNFLLKNIESKKKLSYIYELFYLMWLITWDLGIINLIRKVSNPPF